MKEKNIDPLLLVAVWEQNKNLREDYDWAAKASAVLREN